MTTIAIPDATAGDNVLNDRNAIGAVVEGALNSLDGANIQAATVPQTALAKGKAVFTQCFSLESNLNATTNASVVNGWAFILPNFDGAALTSTITYLGASVVSGFINTSSSSTLTVRSNTATMHTITLTTVNTNNTPVAFAPAAAVNTSSGKIIDVLWTSAGSPQLANTSITLWFSMPHVAT